MGMIHGWPLDTFVPELAATYGIAEFVETGTFEGDGCAFAARIFPRVTTIEIDPAYHAAARRRLSGLPIRFLLGDSAELLPAVVDQLSGPAMFWLDGHAGGGHFGPADICPLIAELAAIARSPFAHFILVDDARAFLAPPPPPFDPDKWPTLVEVLAAARSTIPYHCVVIQDTMIFAPPDAKDDVTRFCNAVRPKI